MWCFGGFFIWVAPLRAGERPMSPQYRKVYPLLEDTEKSSIANYRPIFIPPVLTKAFEDLMSIRLRWFPKSSVVCTQFAYQKGLGTTDSLLSVSHTVQNALESRQEARIMQIDFSAVIWHCQPSGNSLYKLCSAGIWGSVLSILTEFLSNRSQYVMVDDYRS